MKNNHIKNKFKAFTLIEIAVWILIFSIIIVSWFYSLSALMIWKVKLIEETEIEKRAFYFSEKFFEMVKKWWEIDYEEYFNRKVVWTTDYLSWHYEIPTGFGNFWNGGKVENVSSVPNDYWDLYYYCLSPDTWVFMWTWWCVTVNNDSDWIPWWISDTDYSLEPQRYWQYTFHFRDYNVNADDDEWDEDWDSSIIWDDDDEILWNWPTAFEAWVPIKELYLINGKRDKRTLFRWTVSADPEWLPFSCDFTTEPETPTGSGCLWTIEFLKLEWKDWWMNHNSGSIDNNGTQYDWIIDTWIIDPEFAWWTTDIIAWSNNTNYRQKIFPDDVNVKDVIFYVYPNKDIGHAWKDKSPETNIAPYIRMWLTLSPGRRTKKQIKWKVPEITIKTTVALTNIFSN